MAKIKILAGDFYKGGQHQLSFGTMTLFSDKAKWIGEHIPVSELQTVEPASEDSVKKIGGTIGWGALGGVALGPVGLLAGLVLGGKGKEVTFVATLKDGRKMLATTDSKTYAKLQAAVF
ncbi:MAG: hypothetical protein WDZ52_07210 [Pseudohongiellaceae bacterium]